MARGDFPSSKQDQFVLRFPEGLRDKVKKAAEANARSMNAEIVSRLAEFDVLSDKNAFAEIEIRALEARTRDLSERRRQVAEAEAEIERLRQQMSYIKGVNAALEFEIETFTRHLAQATNDRPELLEQILEELRKARPMAKGNEQ